MYKRKLLEVVIFSMLLTLLHRNVEAGPMKRQSRMVREVYPEIDPENEGNQAQVCIVGDVVYGTDEPVPAEQPCLKCRCQPPGVQCETLQCEKRPGCRAIHKPNKCCPDYQCECEHNGKFYANGEKLETPPGGECKVCYCRGGEVQCAEVSCYMRKDCEGKRVPGKCCPKYDHCPPIDPVPGRPAYTTEITLLSSIDKDSFEPWPLIGASSNVTDSILNPTSNDIQDENKIPDINEYETTTISSFKATEVDDLQKEAEAGLLHKITIQEIIPERKEIPITAPPKVETEQGTLIIEEAEEFLNHSNDLVVTDSDADSSEISEVFQQPPPVLRIGDKLLFLKKGEFVPEKDSSTPNSVITIIGAEGLQRIFEESGEIHEVNIENIPGVSLSNETETNKSVTETTENINQSPNEEKNIDIDSNTNNSELNTASSTHILSLVKRKNKPTSTTTEVSTTTSTTESQPLISTTETNLLPETSTLTSTVPAPTNESFLINTTEEDIEETTFGILDITTEENKNATEIVALIETEGTIEAKETSTVQSTTKYYDHLLDHNPAYPPLPEIMGPNIDDASQRFDLGNTDKESDNVTTPATLKILPGVLGIRSNKTVPQNITNSEWLKSNPDTLINYKAVLPYEILKQPASSDFADAFLDTTTTTSELTTSEISPITLVTQTEGVNADTLATERDEKTEETSTDFSVKTEENPRSIESMEESNEDSGESTTKKTSHASLMSNEDASVEGRMSDSSEAVDMVSAKNANSDSGEDITEPTVTDAGMIDKEWTDNSKNSSSNANSKDVEVIDTSTLQKNKPIERAVDATTEEISELDTKVPPYKVIGKRESSPNDERILKELYKDLNADAMGQNVTSDEEKNDSEAIFKELLENTSTPKSAKDAAESRNRETETLQRVSNALTQFSLSGKEPDSSILGTLIKFFNSQYQPYNKK